jgi:hypothetical protein
MKNPPPFTKPENPLSWTQEPTADPHPQMNLVHNLPPYSFKTHWLFSYLHLGFSTWCLPISPLTTTLSAFLVSQTVRNCLIFVITNTSLISPALFCRLNYLWTENIKEFITTQFSLAFLPHPLFNSVACSPQANNIDRATAACRRS